MTKDGGAHWVAQTSGTTQPLQRRLLPRRRARLGGGRRRHDPRHQRRRRQLARSRLRAYRRLGSAASPSPDASHGWAVGDAGVLLATGDGGATLEPRRVRVRRCHSTPSSCPSASHGWAVGTFDHPRHQRRRRPLERPGLGRDAATAPGRLLRRRLARLGGRRLRHDPCHQRRRRPLERTELGHDVAAPRRRLRRRLPRLDGGRRRHDPRHQRRRRPLGRADLGHDAAALRRRLHRTPRHGWAVGDGGTIRATSDGGAHWVGADLRHHAAAPRRRLRRRLATAGRWATAARSSPPATAAPTWVGQTSGTTQPLHGVSFTGRLARLGGGRRRHDPRHQ